MKLKLKQIKSKIQFVNKKEKKRILSNNFDIDNNDNNKVMNN